MKNLIAILFFVFACCGNASSQTNVYKPFPQIYGEWIVMKYGTFTSWQKYEAIGDTILGSYTYKKVTIANNTGYPVWNGTTYVIPFGPGIFSFGYRNDIANKKVYYLDVTGGINKDTLWYDFNLNIGDSVKTTYAYMKNGASYDRIVQSIDSVLICGSYYKRFKFNCGYANSL